MNNSINMNNNLLEIRNLNMRFGGIVAVSDVSFSVEKGKIITLIGANGAGKSTTLRCIAGIYHPQEGEILMNGKNIVGQSPDKIVKQGITLVPEGRHVFPNLTVAENLKIGAYLQKKIPEEEFRYVYELFPRLKEREWQLAGTLSGGEQHMLAVGASYDGRTVARACSYHRGKHFRNNKRNKPPRNDRAADRAERQHGA